MIITLLGTDKLNYIYNSYKKGWDAVIVTACCTCTYVYMNVYLSDVSWTSVSSRSHCRSRTSTAMWTRWPTCSPTKTATRTRKTGPCWSPSTRRWRASRCDVRTTSSCFGSLFFLLFLVCMLLFDGVSVNRCVQESLYVGSSECRTRWVYSGGRSQAHPGSRDVGSVVAPPWLARSFILTIDVKLFMCKPCLIDNLFMFLFKLFIIYSLCFFKLLFYWWRL